MWGRILVGIGFVSIGLSTLFAEALSYYVNLALQKFDPTGSKALSAAPYLIGAALVLIGLAIWFWPWFKELIWGTQKIPTKLVLDYPTQGLPIVMEEQNVHYWYNLVNEMQVVASTGQTITGVITNLFLVFDQFTNYNQIVVVGENIQLPRYEVKSSDNRHAIIAFTGTMPAGRVRVELR